jgi:hypothetical protein
MLANLQRALTRALVGEDPWGALLREREALSPADRALVDRIDRDGFVLTSLLVRKLRFERLCRGDRAFERTFESDPRDTTEAFRAYDTARPPTSPFPSAEARAWNARTPRDGGGR